MRVAPVASLAFLFLSSVVSPQSLFDAARSGTAAQVRSALQDSADVNAADGEGATPLMYAAAFNPDPGVVAALVAAGARVGDRTGRGVTALMLAAGGNASVAVTEALLVAGARVDDQDSGGGTALLYAVEGNQNPEVVRALLRAGAGIASRDRSGLTPLMRAAAFSQNPDVVSVLIGAGAVVDERDGSYNTALIHAAAQNMEASVISRLLEAGADIRARNADGLTPLMAAGRSNGNPEVISALARAGAGVGDRNRGGETALHYAGANNRNPAVIAALIQAGASVDEPDALGRTALIAAAAYTRTPEMIAALLAAGADPRKKDHDGRTAFDWAGQNKSLDGTKARWDLDVTRSLAKGLLIVQYQFYDIFPVFYGHYDTHPLGRVTIMNTLDKPVTGVRMSFFVKELMDAPRDCPLPSTLLPNEPATADLFALFQPRILQVIENTKVEAEVRLEYVEDGQLQTKVVRRTLPVLKRNALAWDDTRRAAAFVSPSDPAVLRFAKNVSSAVSGKTGTALDGNLTMAVAMHDALRLLDVAYSQDPVPVLTPSRAIADFVQFPRQTLENRSGKCSDLSVLYCALLEAVGVETAFVTVPGHIYIAVGLGMTPVEAKGFFGHPDDLLYEEGRVWLPLEVTMRAQEFTVAWQRGAQEWRENKLKGASELVLLREAWKTYEPVALPGPETAVAVPSTRDLAALVEQETAALVAREVAAREALLRERDGGGGPKPLNDLGVLYAKYGLWERAEAQFNAALANGDYLPAFVNLGNLHFVRGDFEKAAAFYNRALGKDPVHPVALAGLARIAEAAGEARRAASGVALVDAAGVTTTRASEAGRFKDLRWDQE